jgi:phosphoinositide-3-kinase regulatory subunit 4
MGTITLAHMRTDTSSWSARQSVALGRLTCGYVDGSSTWLVVGTSNGYLALWDLRYGLQVRNWKISETCITAISGHPVRGSGKWVLVSFQARLWPDQAEGVVDIMASVDVNTGELVERFEVSSNSHKTGRSDMNPNTNAHSSTLRADILPSEVITGILQAPSGSGSSSEKKEDLRSGFDPVRAIHCLDIPVNPAYTSSHELAVVPQDPSDEILGHDNRRNVGNNGNAAVLTAGDDKIIRLWNLAKPSDSFVVSGSGKDAIKRYKCVHATTRASVVLLY